MDLTSLFASFPYELFLPLAASAAIAVIGISLIGSPSVKVQMLTMLVFGSATILAAAAFDHRAATDLFGVAGALLLGELAIIVGLACVGIPALILSSIRTMFARWRGRRHQLA